MIGVVVPAHDEERVLPRLLTALTRDPSAPVRVVVVANGCSDDTAKVARGFGVEVVETAIPSKIKALALGDAALAGHPRAYVDADVVITQSDLGQLADALGDGIHAAGPRRLLPMVGASPLVRLYYQVWELLPGVKAELYGRGVIVVDEEGHRRLRDWPDVMADDLHIAMSFAPHERLVVQDAVAVIQPPKTYLDLLRRRTRTTTGNARLQRAPSGPAVRGGGGSLRFLARLVRRRPGMLPAAVVFVLTTALARLGSRRAVRRNDTGWLRDESSRR